MVLAEESLIDEELEASSSPIYKTTTYETVRRKYDQFIQVTHNETAISSAAETAQINEWMRDIANDAKKIEEADRSFEAFSTKIMEETRKLYYGNFIEPLKRAKAQNIISAESYEAWIRWMRDPNRDSDEKVSALKGSFKEYLRERESLAAERQNLLNDPRLQSAEQSSDKALQAKIQFLKNDNNYFGMEIGQRRNLIDSIKGAVGSLKGGEKHEVFYKDAEKILLAATKAPEPALHRNKVGTWLKRIFESGASPEQIKQFVYGTSGNTLGGLIHTWRKAWKDFRDLRNDKAFAGIRMNFMKTSDFLGKHYNDRLKEIENLKTQRRLALALRTKAESRIKDNKGSLDGSGSARWLNQYLFNGQMTLAQLHATIDGTMVQNLRGKSNIVSRYDKAMKAMKLHKSFKPASIPTKTAFLGLKYGEQTKKLQEMEKSLKILAKNTKEESVVAQISGLMKTDDWEQADQVIKSKWASITSPEHRSTINGFIRTIVEKRKEEDTKEEKESNQEVTALLKDVHTMRSTLSGIPNPVGSFYRSAYALGRSNLWTAITGTYNVVWAKQHKYLSGDRLEKFRERAAEGSQKADKFGTKPRGVENISLETDKAGPNNRMREYNGDWGPTYLHYDVPGPVADTGNSSFAHNYWMLYTPKGWSLQQIESFVTETHPVLKRGLRAEQKLETMGVSISRETAKMEYEHLMGTAA